MSANTYVVIARPDPQSAGRYLASCPDIPGWFATGGSPAEASAMGSEIVRGIVAERRANGGEVPAVNMHAVQVTVGTPVAARPPAMPAAPDARESEPKPSAPNSTLASIVARSREHRPTEGGDGESTSAPSLTQGRILKNNALDA
ncbi:MAG: type II toxin-antitoxin system HicB family antitoxin [Rhodothermales bacterium]